MIYRTDQIYYFYFCFAKKIAQYYLCWNMFVS